MSEIERLATLKGEAYARHKELAAKIAEDDPKSLMRASKAMIAYGKAHLDYMEEAEEAKASIQEVIDKHMREAFSEILETHETVPCTVSIEVACKPGEPGIYTGCSVTLMGEEDLGSQIGEGYGSAQGDEPAVQSTTTRRRRRRV